MTILRAGTATDVGRVRSNNQDSHLVLDAISLYGVADGMGGHQGGEVASAIAVELTGKHATEPTLDSLMAAVRIANRAIFEKAGSDRDLHGMGTTLVAIQLVTSPEGDEVAWVNVGDSRVYLFRDNRLVQLSHDHSLVEDLVRDGQLTPDEAAVHPQRNIITRALGIDLDVAVDGATVLPFTGDRFLLCSDGLFGEVSDDQMTSALRRLADPTEAAEELVRLANEGGGRDNITVVVVEVVDDGGRAEAASVALAEDPTRLASAPVSPVTQPVEEPLFAGQPSSLPESADNFGPLNDDPFANLDEARSRRFTWRVLAFAVLLVFLIGATIGAIAYSASTTYYVAFKGPTVALYRGKQGGVLWFNPELVRATKITRSDVPPALRPTITTGKDFSSRGAADRYLVNLRAQIESAAPAATTSTAVPVTTSTAPGATTTTTSTIPGP